MQAVLLVLVAAVVLPASGFEPPWSLAATHPWLLLAATLGGSVGVASVVGLAGALPWNRIPRGPDGRAVTHAWSRSLRRARLGGTFACLWLSGCTLGFGWLELVRSWVGDLILVDEALALLPAIIALLVVWWAHEPYARALQIASREGYGVTPHAPRHRLRGVIAHARLQLPLLLVPAALVIGMLEIRSRLLPGESWQSEVLGVAASLVVLSLSPALTVRALSTSPLPVGRGSLRERIEDVFRSRRIRLRAVRLWNTDGAMMNGLAMGLLPWCRWVLLTDVLVDSLPEDGVVAVTAHEAGHLRYRHMLTLIGSLVGGLGCAGILVGTLFEWVWSAEAMPTWAPLVADLLAIILGIAFFGFVSRRCERQADAYAVKYLSAAPGAPPSAVITAPAANSMRRALAHVAFANGIGRARRSFRHGSIASRRDRLAAIIGSRLDSLPIDREMRRVNVLVVAAFVASISFAVADSMHRSSTTPPSDLVPIMHASREMP